MMRLTILALLPLSVAGAQTAARTYPLTSTQGLTPHNVRVEAVTHAGKQGVRVVEALGGRQAETLAIIDATDFVNGDIEAEVAGAPAPNAPATARGFVGIAFRLQSDLATYDAFYLRPTNGRADDQERRNHAAQYISHPAWPWDRLRKETPSRYEAYVDLLPDTWTPIRIEVRGTRARLFVHGATQPTLVVNDLKTGPGARGAIALWLDGGTVAHYRNVRVTPLAP